MKRSVILVLLMSPAVLSIGQDLTSLRKTFHKAILDPQKEKIEVFHKEVSKVKPRTPVVKAYQAVSEAMMAQVHWNPISKFNQVKKFRKLIDESVLEDSHSLEIRFLRLGIEYHLPRILGMSDHLEEDKDVIIENLHMITDLNVDPGYARYIVYFMNETGLCKAEEITQMRERLAMNVEN